MSAAGKLWLLIFQLSSIVDCWSYFDVAASEVSMKSVAVFAEESLLLECNVCENLSSHGEYHNNVTIQWYWIAENGEEVEVGTSADDSDFVQSKQAARYSTESFILKIDEAFIVTSESTNKAVLRSTRRGKNLLIDNIQTENSGLYRCRFDGLAKGDGSADVVSYYEVQVSRFTIEKFNYRMETTNESRNSCVQSSWTLRSKETLDEGAPTFELEDAQISVTTLWSEWSSCTVPLCQLNRCGYRKRVGLCYASSTRLDDAKHSRPCRSEFLSPQMRGITKDYADVIEYEECEISDCSQLAEKQDLKNLLESILKSENTTLTSTDSVGHSLAAVVGRLLGKVDYCIFFQRAFENLFLQCGNIRNRSKNILWIQNKNLISPLGHKSKVDILNRLFLPYLEESDTGTYSCWDENRLVGIYIVLVSNIDEYERLMRKWLALIGIPLAFAAIFKSLMRFEWRLHWARQHYSIYHS